MPARTALMLVASAGVTALTGCFSDPLMLHEDSDGSTGAPMAVFSETDGGGTGGESTEESTVGGTTGGGATDGGGTDVESTNGGSTDAGGADGRRTSAGSTDVGSTDGGSTDGVETDDGGSSDGGSTDVGGTDVGSTDGGSTDGGSTDGGSTDVGSTDGGSTDGGSTDGGSTDGGSTDGGSTDGGSTDGGGTDGGSTDSGSTDGGSTDDGSTEGGSTDDGPACDVGTIGCPCDDGACSEGACSAASTTCVAVAPDDMVLVPEGVFSMGCHAATDTACDADENPEHSVTLSAYEIDRLEVSVADYLLCSDEGVCDAPGGGTCTAGLGDDTLPVTCIHNADAADYCAWLSKRLPTEAEWEKAARGTDSRIYPWGDEAPDCTLANFSGCGGVTAPGLLPAGASPYGALDMAGNVWEMVADAYDAGYYAGSPAGDPQGPAPTGSFVIRGGFSGNPSAQLRTSNRAELAENTYGGSIGFRCARDAGS
ncbi:MAG: SUMF1/EgtB/PvdO family nonheme iron enzyme [Myxococcota bacterium]